MPIIRPLLSVVLLTILFGFPIAALAAASVVIRGTVGTTTTTGLAGVDRLVVELIENPGGSVRALQERNISRQSPPFAFTLPSVDSNVLTASGKTFMLRATIARGTTIRFRGTANYAYKPGGAMSITMRIAPATGTLPTTLSGAGWLLLAFVLAGLAGAFAIWRQLRRWALARRLA